MDDIVAVFEVVGEFVGVMDGVWVGDKVGEYDGVGVMVGVLVTFGVGVGVISIGSSSIQPCVSSILIIIVDSLYGDGT